MIVDCHVNIWNDEDVLPHYGSQLGRVRERLIGAKADADTLFRELAGADRAIIFALSYGDTVGIDSSDETTAAAVAKYPDKFVGFAYMDPRRPDYMERLRHAVEDLGLRGVKYGPIYNGVALDYLTALQDRMTELELDLPVLIGGKLNQIPEQTNSSLPRDVTRDIEARGAVACQGPDALFEVLLRLAGESPSRGVSRSG